MGLKENVRWNLLAVILAIIPQLNCKLYQKCELGRELFEKYHFPKNDISKWLCLVHWESGFNTEVINKGSKPNSLDYGIFQINDYKWCKSSSRPSMNKCKMSCDRLRDDDITDDINCLRTIMKYSGFNEWISHSLRCQKNTEEYFADCDITSRSLKIGLGLTSQPKGLKVNVSTKPVRFNLISKLFLGHLRVKPFFSVHQYVTP